MNSPQHDDAALLADTEDPTAALELRVLTGLQAGAALPLDQAITVGRGEDCDMLLLDDGLPEQLLRIETDDQGRLMLEPLSPGLTDLEGQALEAPRPVTPGVPFGLAGVWLEVRPGQAPWTPWVDPAERPATQIAEAQGATAEACVPAGDEADAEPDFHEWADDIRASDRAVPATNAGAESTAMDEAWDLLALDPGEQQALRVKPVPTRRAWRAPTWLVLGGGAVLTVFGLGAIAIQLGFPSMGSAMAESQGATVRSDAAPTVAAATGTAPPVSAPTSALASAPSSGDLAETRHMMPTPESAPAPAAGLTVLRGDEAITLPFQVREVVLGPRSRIVLRDGRTLAPGESVGQWRLMEIRAGTLVFDGPERVLLPW